jgi:hypothetical protein
MVVSISVPGLAEAHQASMSWSTVQVGEGGAVDYTLQLSARDLYEVLKLDRDREATDDEITRGADALFKYVFERVRVTSDGEVCPLERGTATVLHQNDRFAELRFVARCPRIGVLGVDYGLFFELDPRHTAELKVIVGGKSVVQELSKGLQHFEWKLGDSSTPQSLGILTYIGHGMMHIYTGYDHIAFVIGLLLVAAVCWRDEKWQVRGLGAGVPYVLKIVTAFTLAHSMTLILAALDVISLPSRFVESAIAASIVYVAVENVWVGDPRGRWPLAFGFGLVHGLGFAASLRPLLPKTGAVVPLLAFNVGVELGQLSIVLLLLPMLHAVARAAAEGYRRWVVLGGSAIIGALGAIWLAERILDVKIVSQYFGGS